MRGSRWSKPAARPASMAMALVLLWTSATFARRTELEPGWNLFSPEQDIEMGRQVAQEAERELSIVDDRPLNDYLNRLRRQLAAVAPGEEYPYQFNG